MSNGVNLAEGLENYKRDYPEASALFDASKLNQPIKEIKAFYHLETLIS